MLKPENERTLDQPEEEIENLQTIDCFDFVQVECGQKHTLLLNDQGAVFSFGEGLNGQLGTNKKEIQQYDIVQLSFEKWNKPGGNEKIAKIKAAAFNCAAFTEKGKVYLWGSTANGKMGVSRENIEVPTEVCWQERMLDDDEVELRTVILRDERKRPVDAISKIKCIEWGEEHGLILDKKGRLFGMGRTNQGLLGLEDHEFDEIVTNPKQITLNLPNAGSSN